MALQGALPKYSVLLGFPREEPNWTLEVDVKTANETGGVSYRTMAGKLGISHNAVKLALKGEPGVSEETRCRVIRLARELGYPGLSAFYEFTVGAHMPAGSQRRVLAGFMIDWLQDHGVKVIEYPALPLDGRLGEIGVLVDFVADPAALLAVQRLHPRLPILVFFEPVAGVDTDVFVIESVPGWADRAVLAPGRFLREEHLDMLRARLKMLAADPVAQKCVATFHHAAAGKGRRAGFTGTPVLTPGTPVTKTTMVAIAKKVKVSAATVSNALQGKGNISDRLRQQIVNIAWNKGCRQIHAKQTKEIIVFDQWPLKPDHIFNRFCGTLGAIAESLGNLHISHITTLDPNFIRKSIYNLRPDGVILFYDRQDLVEAASEQIDPVICPGVSLVSPARHLNMDCILEDHEGAVRRLIERFAQKGCRSFGYLGTNYPVGTAFQKRFSAFKREIKRLGLSAPPKWQMLFTEAESKKWGHVRPHLAMHADILRKVSAVRKASGKFPDAIICYNDNFAVALTRVLREMNVQGVRISGWGNQEVLIHAEQEVSTVGIDLQAMALAAVNLISARIERPYAPLQTIVLRSQILSAEPAASRAASGQA
jgi:DNA-binding LacI/PurR family transcriptional regulator